MKITEILEGRRFARKTYGPDVGDPTGPDSSETVEVRGETLTLGEIKKSLDNLYHQLDQMDYDAPDAQRINDEIMAEINDLHDAISPLYRRFRTQR